MADPNPSLDSRTRWHLQAMVTYLIDQWTFDDVPKDTIKVLGAGCVFCFASLGCQYC